MHKAQHIIGGHYLPQSDQVRFCQTKSDQIGLRATGLA